MGRIDAITARRIAFLERELTRMGDDAEDAEQGLRLNPADMLAARRVQAIYALANETWQKINELRAASPLHHAIRYDRHFDPSAERSYRQTLG